MASSREFTQFKDLVPDIMRRVEGAPQPTIINELRDAWDYIAKATLLWEDELDPIAVVANQPTYILPAPAFGQVHRIVDASYLDVGASVPRPFPSMTIDMLRARGQTFLPYQNFFSQYSQQSDWRTMVGTPKVWTHYLDNRGVRPVPIPQVSDVGTPALPGGLMNFTCTWVPSRDADGLPTWIADRYWKLLGSRVRWSLFSMAGKAFTNAKQAALENDIFEEQLDMATADRVKSNTRGPLRVEPREPIA